MFWNNRMLLARASGRIEVVEAYYDDPPPWKTAVAHLISGAGTAYYEDITPERAAEMARKPVVEYNQRLDAFFELPSAAASAYYRQQAERVPESWPDYEYEVIYCLLMAEALAPEEEDYP